MDRRIVAQLTTFLLNKGLSDEEVRFLWCFANHHLVFMFLEEITPSLKNTTDARLFEAGKL